MIFRGGLREGVQYKVQVCCMQFCFCVHHSINVMSFMMEERLVVLREYFAVIFSKRGNMQLQLNGEVSGAT